MKGGTEKFLKKASRGVCPHCSRERHELGTGTFPGRCHWAWSADAFIMASTRHLLLEQAESFVIGETYFREFACLRFLDWENEKGPLKKKHKNIPLSDMGSKFSKQGKKSYS